MIRDTGDQLLGFQGNKKSKDILLIKLWILQVQILFIPSGTHSDTIYYGKHSTYSQLLQSEVYN